MSMTPERYQRAKALFQSALDRAPSDRSAFLAEACAGDDSLRSEVESLIAHERASFSEALSFEAAAETLPDDEPESAVGRTIGPYKLIRELGHGGIGAVYLATRADDQYRKRVAIKLIRRGMDTDFILSRFRHERQILAGLSHPNIARLLDGGTTEDGLPYLVMEYIEGKPIDEYCDSHKLSTAERLTLFRTVCAAVHYAHQNLVVHRDLKPGNILVTVDGTVKLLDFGIAKLLNPELSSETLAPTATMVRLMTPEYASPEQVRGETITTASDIYSLGVLLYELLTGHSPYRVKSLSPMEIARVVCEQDPEKPSTAVSRVETAPGRDDTTAVEDTPELVSRVREGEPGRLRRRLEGDLDNIVLMALRKEPQRRYASVEQFSDDIRRHLAGLPVIARKDTFVYRTEKFLQRHKAGVAAVSLIAVTLVGGIVATTWEARVARVERARAERRFNDVRKLANSFVFEFHDAIEKLPGATPARELLVKRALEYLDSLSREARNEQALQLELAAAYTRLGNIQWNRYYANLGDLAGARESQRKALAIREAVLAANPANQDARRALGSSYLLVGDVLVAMDELNRALEHYQKSLKIREELAAANPGNKEDRRNLAVSHQRIGDTLGNPGDDRAGALEHYRKMQVIFEVLAAEPQATADDRHSVAIGYEKLGRILEANGDLAGAAEFYRKELAIFRDNSLAHPTNVQFKRDLAIGYGDVGGALAQFGDWDGALEHYREALKIHQELVAADSTDAGARGDLAFIQGVIADALAARADPSSAMGNYRQALAIFEEMYAVDATDPVVHRRLANVLNKLATLSARLNQPAQARNYAMRLLAMQKAQADRPVARASDLNAYARSLLTCEPEELRRPAIALTYALRAVELSRGNDAAVLDTLALAYHMTGNHSRAIETEEKALALLLPNSSLRHDLEANLAKFKTAATSAQVR